MYLDHSRLSCLPLNHLIDEQQTRTSDCQRVFIRHVVVISQLYKSCLDYMTVMLIDEEAAGERYQ